MNRGTAFHRSRPAATQRRRTAGFTLIEISVVVVIIAVFFTTATVKLDSFLPGSRSESGARQLLSTFDLARTSAVAYGRSYQVQLDLDEGRYRILTPFDQEGKLARAEEERLALDWEELPDGVSFAAVVDSSGTDVVKGIYALSFDAIGSAEEVFVHLDNAAGQAYALTVRILALTGNSTVLRGKRLPQIVTEDDF